MLSLISKTFLDRLLKFSGWKSPWIIKTSIDRRNFLPDIQKKPNKNRLRMQLENKKSSKAEFSNLKVISSGTSG